MGLLLKFLAEFLNFVSKKSNCTLNIEITVNFTKNEFYKD